MKRFCVIGFPVSHSLSPLMHGAAIRALGIDATYEAVEVRPENLKDFMSVFAEQYAGMNVTIPHKVAVMRYLDEIDDRARTIGAINTVVVDGGKLIGYNTDWIGFTEALIDGSGQKNAAFLQYKPVLVIGAGGAARAICFAARHLGAQLYITNRTFEKAEQLALEFGGHALHLNELNKIDPILVVNVTSVGMAPHENESPIFPDVKSVQGMNRWMEWNRDRSNVAAEGENSSTTVPGIPRLAFDCVYTPRQTPFLKDAEKAGFKSITGDTMLVHQGAAAFELFTGKKAPIEIMKKSVLSCL